MSVCGGSSTCCSVSRGVVIVARKRCIRSGRHCANAPRLTPDGAALPATEAAAAGPPPPRRRLAPGPGAWKPSFVRQAWISCLLGRGRRRDCAVDVDPVAAGLDLRDDLRHLPFLVHRLQRQGRRDRVDAVELGDLVRLRLRERQLRARQEEVVHELRAGLAELREIGHDGPVRLDDVTRTAAAERASACVLLGRAGHRQVGADAGERVEGRALRLVEPASRGSRSRSRGRRRRQGRAASRSSGLVFGGARRGDSGHRTWTDRTTPPKTQLRVEPAQRAGRRGRPTLGGGTRWSRRSRA